MSDPRRFVSPRPAGGDLDATLRIVLPEVPVSYRQRTAAETVDVSRPLIAAEIKAGRLAALRLGGVVLISRAALQVWLDERAVPWVRK